MNLNTINILPLVGKAKLLHIIIHLDHWVACCFCEECWQHEKMLSLEEISHANITTWGGGACVCARTYTPTHNNVSSSSIDVSRCGPKLKTLHVLTCDSCFIIKFLMRLFSLLTSPPCESSISPWILTKVCLRNRQKKRILLALPTKARIFCLDSL
jgi:hypothetical protein